ncbi:hypothetical protein GCM10009759_02310 [Kitasatospora saccharophila]|uniref:Uncharacterized protein n=1 Tax=Kitasatospora saccharophila TaxID=407973 RepID=A0ABN2W754_9ACTN
MTAHRIPGPTARRLLALPAVLAVTLATGACTGGSDDRPGAVLSYAEVRSTAQQLGEQGSDTCPFGLDLPAALKAAGVDLTATGGSTDDRPATGETREGQGPVPWPSGMTPPSSMPSAPGTPPHGRITCVWTADGGPVELDLLAVPLNDVGLNIMLPSIARAGNLPASRLEEVAAHRPAPGGPPLLTPDGGLAAVARIPAKGDGDLVLLLSQDPPDDGEHVLSGESLGKVLARLAAGVHG